MEVLPEALNALKTRKQFMVWILIPSKVRPGKMDKLPVDFHTGHYPVNAQNPLYWTDDQTAIQKAKQFGKEYGVGFVFTADDPFWFLDIDECMDHLGAEPSQIASTLLLAFKGAAVEVSSSGRGFHIIGSGQLPAHGTRDHQNLGLEFYTDRRFVALTGTNASGDAGLDCSAVLQWLVETYFLPSRSDFSGGKEWTTNAYEGWTGVEDDDQLIDRALQSRPSSRAVFRSTATFRDLWEGSKELERLYPDDNQGRGYDESRVDAALAWHLAYWTGENCERILRLMFRSSLVRDKWDREDYLRRTIVYACQLQKNIRENKLDVQVLSTPSPVINSAVEPASNLGWTDVSIHDIFTNPPGPLQFLIEQILPAELLTLLAGHGGSGKSMLALQIAVCMAMGRSFMGKEVKKSRVIFFSGEDSGQIIQIRLIKICQHMDVAPPILSENLKIINATNNPFLYMENGNRQAGRTVGYNELLALTKAFKAEAVIIDNASDTFDANEINRAQVRGYVRELTQLGVAVLLLAHVDKQTAKGEKSSEGYSGSTQWHNSARSRLYLENGDNGGLLTLCHKKSNHGTRSGDIHLAWSPDGILVGLTPMDAQDTIDTLLSLIGKHYERNSFISTSQTSKMNASLVLRADPGFPAGVRTNKELWTLLCRAEDDGLLVRKIIPAKKRGETIEIYVLAPTALSKPGHT